MPVNWLKTWRRASFRGAQFWVEFDQIETGRRLVVHEFPHRDVPYIEDMGRAKNRIEVTAYIASDAALSETAALFNACQQRGAATLQLPAERLKAQCARCERAWDKDRQGYFAFRLMFWREGTGPGPYPAPYLGRMAFVAAGEVIEPLREAFVAGAQVVGQPGLVRDAMVEAIRAVAVEIDAVRAGLALDADAAPQIARAVQDFYDDAETLADIGAIGDTWTATSFRAAAAGDSTAAVVSRVGALVAAMRSAASEQKAATAALAPMLDYGADSTRTGGATPTVRQLRANAAAVALILRIAALSQWVIAHTEAEYRDRRAAIQARADISEAIDVELERLTDERAYKLYIAIAELRGHAVAYLSRRLTDLAPIVAVGTNISMPSLWLANMLYGDAERASELVERNRVIHPSFMPTDIEALAR